MMTSTRRTVVAVMAGLLGLATAVAQTPPPPAKRLPPAGVAIPAAAREELTRGAVALRAEIDALAKELAAARDGRAALLPDIEVLHKAVDWAVRYDEIFDAKQVEPARKFLRLGRERMADLRAGRAPWTTATGCVLRGYRSAIDDSVQPYALVVPPEWTAEPKAPRRLDVVLSGRNEKRSELAFLLEHETKPGEIVPAGAILLYPYGRFCNATKFAGETDVFEALAAVRAAYPVDPQRIVVRGFSMGGASTWHLAGHYPGLWAAAGPGAGFAETAEYAKVDAPGKPERMPWERTLWRWYDATGYASNLRHVPTVAYSGEIDPQKQAADIMTKAMAAEGLTLEHLIGPQTAHKYHPETKAALAKRLEELAAKGRDEAPAMVRFTTYTLRYAGMPGLRIEAVERPWERVDVTLERDGAGRIFRVTTANVRALALAAPHAPAAKLTIDGRAVAVDGAATVHLEKTATGWRQGMAEAGARRKQPGLFGPVNDAFLDRFLFVRPTGPALNPTVAAWVESELRHATKLWRDIFRGEVRIVDDTAVTDREMETSHVVLWGDASSNRVLARMLATQKLPLAWDARTVTLRGKAHDAAHHAPVLIFPNPLTTASRYVVVNSGMDFREEAYGTNSLQTPKLPDYAMIDLREPAGARWPGKVVDAGFFDADWK